MWRREDTPEPASRATEQSHQSNSGDARLGEMHPLAQRVARAQHRDEAARQRLGAVKPMQVPTMQMPEMPKLSYAKPSTGMADVVNQIKDVFNPKKDKRMTV